MAKLTTLQRKRLPASVFGGPDRSYPVPDKGHAEAAIVDASKEEHRGKLSSAAEKRIVAKAHRVLKG